MQKITLIEPYSYTQDIVDFRILKSDWVRAPLTSENLQNTLYIS